MWQGHGPIEKRDGEVKTRVIQEELLPDFGLVPCHMIAIIGPQGEGKSTHIASLVSRVRALAQKGFPWTLTPVGRRALDIEKNAKKIEMGKMLNATQVADPNARKPVFYTLEYMSQHGEVQKILLLFYDLAGELFEDPSELEKSGLGRYIYGASGIILLLDPLRWKSVQEFETIRDEYKKAFPNPQRDMNNMIPMMLTYLQDHNPAARKIPIAVTLSKIDMLQKGKGELFESDFPLFSYGNETAHRGKFCVQDAMLVDSFVKHWIDRMDTSRHGPQMDVLNQIRLFRTTIF